SRSIFTGSTNLVYLSTLPPLQSPLPQYSLVRLTTTSPETGVQNLGIGVYNPSSTYAVRLLLDGRDPFFPLVSSLSTSSEMMRSTIALILQRCVMARGLQGLPGEGTDCYRLANGDGDMLSGVSVDVFGDDVVVMIQAGWAVMWREVLVGCVKEATGKENVRVRVGWDRVKTDHGGDGLREVWEEGGEEGGVTVIKENGVKYLYDHAETQKTGFYTDQRDNRRMLAGMARGKKVLDLCCYVGSFSLNAVVGGGAIEATGVDSSARAVAQAEGNALANGVEGKCTFVKEDVAKFMRRKGEEGERWDVVVLDPPKLAPTVKGLSRAVTKYATLNRDAVKLISPSGGVLLTCTCSSAMTNGGEGRLFTDTVVKAVRNAGRTGRVVKKTHTAGCHAGGSEYLTALTVVVDPIEDVNGTR
ncbi:hypothetical protein TrRE_jg453, partial [Triparma retinervis]